MILKSVPGLDIGLEQKGNYGAKSYIAILKIA